jgi:hypothetical protein
MEPERGLRPVLVISAILIAGIPTKLDAAWLGMISWIAPDYALIIGRSRETI